MNNLFQALANTGSPLHTLLHQIYKFMSTFNFEKIRDSRDILCITAISIKKENIVTQGHHKGKTCPAEMKYLLTEDDKATTKWIVHFITEFAFAALSFRSGILVLFRSDIIYSLKF